MKIEITVHRSNCNTNFSVSKVDSENEDWNGRCSIPLGAIMKRVSKVDSENEDWNGSASTSSFFLNFCFKSRFRKWRLKLQCRNNNDFTFYSVSKVDSENEDWNLINQIVYHLTEILCFKSRFRKWRLKYPKVGMPRACAFLFQK